MSCRRDPRIYQIAVLSSLLVYGIAWLDFDVSLSRVALLLGAALLTQAWATRQWGLPHFDPRSPLISGLSLCLLLRTDSAPLAMGAAVLTILSKFVFRIDNRHFFNPTNFGIIAMMLLSDRVWASPGQWGSTAWLAFLFACVGGLVIHRAARSDVTYAFLGFYLAIVFGRALWLGDPLAVPLHQLQNGGLLLFAFFMISDPKTTPNSRAGRVLFALIVASTSAWIHFGLFRTNGFLWALAPSALTVPLINRLLPGGAFEWTGAGSMTYAPQQGEKDETSSFSGRKDRDVRHDHHSRSERDAPGHPTNGRGVLRVLRGQSGRAAVQPGVEGGSGSTR